MLLRSDGTPTSNASLLHVSMGDETLDRILETYYSPANLGGIGRGDFRQQILAANPNLLRSGSIVRSNQLVRIDLSPSRPSSLMCRMDEARVDLDQCNRLWRGMSSAQREHIQEHAYMLLVLEKFNELWPVFVTGLAEGVHEIFKETGELIHLVEAHYMRGAPGATQTLSRAYYAARTKIIKSAAHKLGPFFRWWATSKSINSALKVTGAQGRMVKALLATEGNASGVKLFGDLFTRVSRLSLAFKAGAVLLYGVDFTLKTREVICARKEVRLGKALKNYSGFAASFATGTWAMGLVLTGTGGVMLVLIAALGPTIMDVAAGGLVQGIGEKFDIKFEDEHGVIHEDSNAVLLGICPIRSQPL